MITGCGTLFPTFSTTSRTLCIIVFGASFASLMTPLLTIECVSLDPTFFHSFHNQGRKTPRGSGPAKPGLFTKDS